MRFEETNPFSPSQLDFVPRNRRNQSGKLVVAFGLMIALVLILGLLPNLASHSITSIFLAVTLGILCFFVAVRNQQNLDLIMNTEHQNMLFTQALALDSSFYLFVRRDGTIVSASASLQNLFPPIDHLHTQPLENILASANTSIEDRERIMGSIYNYLADKLVIPLQTRTGERKEFVLTLEPLARPAGFMLLRGREFRGARSGVESMPDMLRTTSADKLDHLLSHAPVGHYATDAFGRIEYANGAFAHGLGYEVNELLAQRLSIPYLVHALAGIPLSSDYSLADFQGPALLRYKDGTLIESTLFQHMIRDENNRVTGATGSIIFAGTPQG